MFITLVLNEIKHSVITMRFFVSLIFVLLVYTGSSIVFSKKFLNDNANDIRHQQQYQSSLESGRNGLESLYTGGVALWKAPILSSFFSTGNERRFPKGMVIVPSAPQGASASGSMTVSSPGINYKIENYTEFDLTFIVGVVLSFLVVVLSFDAVSGEREQGTFRQIFSNTVPRWKILCGKFIAILAVLLIMVLLGSILSTLIFQLRLNENVLFLFPLSTLLSFLVSLFYLSIFIFLGLVISASVSKSSTSLALQLLIWISFVVLSPNVGGILAQRLYHVSSQEEHNANFQAILNAKPPPPEFTEFFLGRGNEDQWKSVDQYEQRLNASLEQLVIQRFNELTNQGEKAEMISLFSPYATFKYIMEQIAGTGLRYHSKFFQAARQYRNELLQFIRNEDMNDLQSKHHLVNLRQLRSMSNKPVDPAIIPRFVPPTRHISAEDVVAALPAVGYLLLLNFIFFGFALYRFGRMDVR